MKPGGGKAKGSEFERMVCRDLSEWISAGTRDDLFWRSAMSGGRASVQFKKGKENLTQTGDITAIDPLGVPLVEKFLVECKFYKDLDFGGAITGNEGGITGFWTELVHKAAQHKKLPFLIAKQNRIPPVVVLDPEGAEFLQIYHKVICYLPVHHMRMIWYEAFLKEAVPPGGKPKPKLKFKSRR